MNHLRFTFPVTLALTLALAAAAPRPALAECLIPCNALLCGGRKPPTMVTGTIQPEAGDGSRFVVVVDAVLRVQPGARTPQRGDRLPGWSLTSARSGPVVGHYEGNDLSIPMGVFPLAADGNVQCRGSGESTSAPEGQGVKVPRLAELQETGDCHAELEKAGYPRPACDDNGGFGCALGGGGQPSGPAACAFLLVVGLFVVTASRRSRAKT